MRNLFKKMNDKGSTLLTVIICIALIGILGSMMLSVTMTNLQMKILESKSKENFYSCEQAMEEIRVGVQEITVDTIKDFYENNVLASYANYINMPENDRNLEIQNAVAVALLRKLGGFAVGDATITTDTVIIPTTNVLAPYTTASAPILTVGMPTLYSEGAFITNDGVTETFSDAYIVIRGIEITYTNDEYMSAISSDIKVIIPKFSFTEGTQIINKSMDQPFKDYVLIADGGINFNNYTLPNEIRGSVYAGDIGISINSKDNTKPQVTIKGENIVTRGDIRVTDKAKLKIDTYTKLDGSLVTPIIWANNLITQTSDLDLTNNPFIDINGICVIKDDLVLEGPNSNVTLKGAYAGYTGTHTSVGSAMMINGSGSSLNLTDLTSLILAGRAHVSVEDAVINKDADILTGESIAFKSNQRAYLVPGKFIENIGHNPVTVNDYVPPAVPNIIIPDAIDPITQINYKSYVVNTPLLDPIEYKIAAKQTGGSVLRYYYLNLRDGKLADKYLVDYMAYNSATINVMTPFSLGSVTLPTDMTDVKCVGNLMSYTSVSPAPKTIQLTKGLSDLYTTDAFLDSDMALLPLSSSIFNGTGLKDKTISMLPSLYSKINHLLSLDVTKVYDETAQVVKSSIIPNGVNQIITDDIPLSTDTVFTRIVSNLPYTFSNKSATEQTFAVIKGDVTISNSTASDPIIFNGFMIATGNIMIGDNAKINGIIISTGETNTGDITVGNGVYVNGRLAAAGAINIGSGCTFETKKTATESTEDDIAKIFTDEGTILENLFGNQVTTINFTESLPASSLVDLSNMISYENWQKLE